MSGLILLKMAERQNDIGTIRSKRRVQHIVAPSVEHRWKNYLYLHSPDGACVLHAYYLHIGSAEVHGDCLLQFAIWQNHVICNRLRLLLPRDATIQRMLARY